MKENQEIYDANQRELNSLQFELVKSDNAAWLHFFLRRILFIQEPSGMNLNDSHYFANWKCYSRLNQCRSMHTKWGHIFDAICTISDIMHYTKLCKLARLEWMNEWMFICYAINSITGESMDVKIIVTRRPQETSWLISGPPHMPIINQNNLTQSWTYLFVLLMLLVSFYNSSKNSVEHYPP